MTTQSNGATAFEEFRYPLSGTAAEDGWQKVLSAHSGSRLPVSPGESATTSSETWQGSESTSTFEQVRAEGIEEGRRIERLERAAQQQQAEERRDEQVRRCCDLYESERNQLLQSLELEVVKLALHIAERIVRREVQIDPLVLTGAVRVALGQLAEKSKVRIRVPAVDAAFWSETLARLPNLRTKPEIAADELLRSGECELECDCGVADLSVASQLQGIAHNLLGEEEAVSPSRSRHDQSTAERSR